MTRLSDHRQQQEKNRETVMLSVDEKPKDDKIIADLEKVDQVFAWNQLASSSQRINSLQEAGGKTVVVIHGVSSSSLSSIDFINQDRSNDLLLPSYSLFVSLGALSPGLLRLLGSAHSNKIGRAHV